MVSTKAGSTKAESASQKAAKNASGAAKTPSVELGKTGGPGRRKVREGFVVAAKMQKTVTVAIGRRIKHSVYGKFVRRTAQYLVHDERSECGVGDLVEIVETRPLSRHKRWRVRRIVTKAK